MLVGGLQRVRDVVDQVLCVLGNLEIRANVLKVQIAFEGDLGLRPYRFGRRAVERIERPPDNIQRTAVLHARRFRAIAAVGTFHGDLVEIPCGRHLPTELEDRLRICHTCAIHARFRILRAGSIAIAVGRTRCRARSVIRIRTVSRHTLVERAAVAVIAIRIENALGRLACAIRVATRVAVARIDVCQIARLVGLTRVSRDRPRTIQTSVLGQSRTICIAVARSAIRHRVILTLSIRATPIFGATVGVGAICIRVTHSAIRD